MDLIRADKPERTLDAIRDGAAVRAYPVALGFAPEGDKERQGDGPAPEGTFRTDRVNAASRFHLSPGLDHPRAEDVAPGGRRRGPTRPAATSSSTGGRAGWT